MEPEPHGAAFFTLEPEPTQVGREPWPPGVGASQKSGGSALLVLSYLHVEPSSLAYLYLGPW